MRRSPLLALALLVALAGCPAGIEVTGTAGAPGSGATGGTGSGSGGGSGSSAAGAALVGKWARTVWVTDAAGELHSSQTVWSFLSDGEASRAVVSWDAATGYSDTVVTWFWWRVNGSQLELDYQPPDAGSIGFGWKIESGVLYLGGTAFNRVSP